MQTREHSTLTAASDQLGIGDKLAFLACYSRYYLSVSADNHGQLSELLESELAGVVRLCRVDAEELSRHNVALLIANGFGLLDGAPGAGVELEAIDQLVKSDELRPIVLVEDSHSLSEGKLRQLLVLAERLGFGLALFGTEALGRRKACTQFENRIFHTTVPKLSHSDVRQLVRRRSESETELSDVAIDDLVDRSEGQPDKLDILINDVIESPPRRIGLPLVHMSALIVLAVVIVGGWMSINGEAPDTTVIALNLENNGAPVPSISTRDPETNSKSSTLPIDETDPTAVAEARKDINQVINDRDAGILEAVPPFTTQNVTAGTTAKEPTRVESEPIKSLVVAPRTDPRTDPRTTAPRTTQTKPTVLASADPNAWVNELPPTASGRVSQSNWLLSAPDAAYTLQLMGSHSEARVLAFIEEQGSGQEFGYFEAKHRNQPWFVLTLGQYPDRDRALQAIALLPPTLRAQKPWARSVASIRGN